MKPTIYEIKRYRAYKKDMLENQLKPRGPKEWVLAYRKQQEKVRAKQPKPRRPSTCKRCVVRFHLPNSALCHWCKDGISPQEEEKRARDLTTKSRPNKIKTKVRRKKRGKAKTQPSDKGGVQSVRKSAKVGKIQHVRSASSGS